MAAPLEDKLFTPRLVAVAGWSDIPPRNIGAEFTEMDVTIDRSQLTGTDESLVMEAQFELSLDGGASWGVDDQQKFGMQFSDGALVFHGVPVLKSTRTFALPQPELTNRRIRGQYRVLLARVWGFALNFR